MPVQKVSQSAAGFCLKAHVCSSQTSCQTGACAHTHAKDSVIVMFVSPRKCPGVDTRLTINRDAFAGLNQEVINRYRLRGVSVALFLYAEWLLFLPLHQHDTM